MQPGLNIAQLEQHLSSLTHILQAPNQYRPYLDTENYRIAKESNKSGHQLVAFDGSASMQTHPDERIWAQEIARTTPINTLPDRHMSMPSEDQAIILPVKGLNIPFVDLALHEGDNVVVERLPEQMFTVLGLVNKPGNFEYPPGVDYNLMEAIAFAGGLNPNLEPRYAVIYRLKPGGEITHAIVDIKQAVNNKGYPNAMAVSIKPRDIIAIEHTPRTRTQKFILDTFRFSIGAYIRPFED
jgi:hypothetical protein